VNICFPVGNTGLIALILHFYSAGFSVPVVDSLPVGIKPYWGRNKPKGVSAIGLALFDRWTQVTGA
jgi:hypothetical protein